MNEIMPQRYYIRVTTAVAVGNSLGLASCLPLLRRYLSLFLLSDQRKRRESEEEEEEEEWKASQLSSFFL